MEKKRVLFVCIHNSARSQMADELLKHLAGDRFDVQSAGISPGTVNPLAVEALKELDIDITDKPTQSVHDLLERNEQFDYVITVCDETSAQQCPTFPSISARYHWGFPDPSQFEGEWEEKVAKTREVREHIQTKIEEWLNEF